MNSIKELKSKKDTLSRIDRIMFMREDKGDPFEHKMAWAVMYGLIGLFLALYLSLGFLDLPLYSSVFGSCLIGCLISVSFNYLSNTPKTWSLVIDNLLSQYEPIDRDAFKHLQSVTLESGFLDFKKVAEFIKKESNALDLAIKKAKLEANPESLNFTKNNTN